MAGEDQRGDVASHYASPYITGTLACDLALEARHDMRNYTLFDFSIFASRSSHLDIIEELIDKPKCAVYRLRNLHAKVLMDEPRFASVCTLWRMALSKWKSSHV